MQGDVLGLDGHQRGGGRRGRRALGGDRRGLDVDRRGLGGDGRGLRGDLGADLLGDGLLGGGRLGLALGRRRAAFLAAVRPSWLLATCRPSCRPPWRWTAGRRPGRRSRGAPQTTSWGGGEDADPEIKADLGWIRRILKELTYRSRELDRWTSESVGEVEEVNESQLRGRRRAGVPEKEEEEEGRRRRKKDLEAAAQRAKSGRRSTRAKREVRLSVRVPARTR